MSYTPNASTTSLSNSSSLPLNDTESFVGIYEDVSMFDSFIVSLSTNTDCTVTVTFSPDGINPDSNLSFNFISSKINPPRRYTITRKYVRVTVLNNSGSNQTYLRLQCSYGIKQALNFPLDGTLAQGADSISTRIMDYYIDCSRGKREGQTPWTKWGYNQDIDSASSETIWSAGGDITPMSSSETLNIVSDSANDDLGAAGLESIMIVGTGPGYVYQTEDVTLDGTTTVTTSKSWVGVVNRVTPLSSGSNKNNIGNITVSGTTSGNTQAYLPAGKGITQQAFIGVPSGKTFFANWFRFNMVKISGGGAPNVTIQGWIEELENGIRYQVFEENYDTSIENQATLQTPISFDVPEKSMLEFRGETDTNNTTFNVRFTGMMIDDS